MKFTATGSICGPAALTLGQLPRTSGIFGLGHRGFIPRDFSQHIAHTLSAAGYETVTGERMKDYHLGAQHTGCGCNETHRVCGYERTVPNDEVVDFIQESHERPYFLSISHTITHRKESGFETDPDPRDDPRYAAPPAPLADTPELRGDWAHSKSDARTLDDEFGAILDAVERSGEVDNTLVIATTDHGAPFPGMKCNLNVQGCGVLLIMRGPGGFEGGKVLDALVSNLDIYPTLCDLAGAAKPDFLQGKSLLPLLSGEVDEIHDFITGEVTYHAAYEPKRCIREKRWVYGRRFSERERPVLPNIDMGPSKSAWLAHGHQERPVDQEELYDTFYDPQEMNNLVYNPHYRDKVAEMRQKLEDLDEVCGRSLAARRCARPC